MRNLLCTVLCFVYCYTLSIATNIDSLKHQLSITNSSFQKSKLLSNIARRFIESGEGDSILHYANLAILQLEPTNQSESMMNAKLLSGVGCWKKGDYNNAMEIFQVCKTIAEKRKYNKLLRRINSNIALIHLEQSNYDEAIEIWSKQKKDAASKKFRSINNLKHLNLGLAHRLKGNYDEALNYFLEGLALSESLKDTSKQILFNNNLGLIYREYGDSLKALKLFEKTEKLAVLVGNNRLEARAQINIGTSYMDMRKYDKALAYFESGLNKLKKSSNKKGIANALSNIANLYLQRNDLEQSQIALDEAMELVTKMGNKLMIITLDRLQSKIYFEKGKHKEAIEILETAKAKSNDINSTFELNKIILDLSKYYAKIGQFEKVQNELANYSKNINADKKNNQAIRLANIENLFELEKTKRVIAEHKTQIKGRLAFEKFWKMIAFMSVLATLCLGFALRYRYKLSKLIKARNNKLVSYNNTLTSESAELKLINDTLEIELNSINDKLNEADFVKEGTIILSNRQKTLLKLGDIIYIKASQNGVHIITTNEKFIYWKGIGKFLMDLPPSLFVKTHRSYIVNKVHVKAIQSDQLKMSNGDLVRIGGDYKVVASSQIKGTS